MKIAFLSQHFSNGGAERAISALSKHLPGDIEQVLIVFEIPNGYPFNGRVINLKVPHTSLGIAARALSFWRRLRRLREAIREERPDVVVSFLGEPNILNALSSRRPVLSFHNPIAGMHSGISGHFLRVLLPLLSRVGTNIAVSEGLRQELVTSYLFPPGRTVTLPNPLSLNDLTSTENGSHSNPFDDGRPFILVLGRLAPEKAPACALRAFAGLKPPNPMGLVFIGQGPELEGLRVLARSLGREDAVKFLGWREDPFPFLRGASLLLNASRYEGFGYAIIEAMACGIPVVATDAPFGPREILLGSTETPGGSDSGILVPACPCADSARRTPTQEEREITAAISTVFDNPTVTAHRVANARIRALDFSAPLIAGRYLEVFRKAASS